MNTSGQPKCSTGLDIFKKIAYNTLQFQTDNTSNRATVSAGIAALFACPESMCKRPQRMKGSADIIRSRLHERLLRNHSRKREEDYA